MYGKLYIYIYIYNCMGSMFHVVYSNYTLLTGDSEPKTVLVYTPLEKMTRVWPVNEITGLRPEHVHAFLPPRYALLIMLPLSGE